MNCQTLSKNNFPSVNNGFTLIELLISIAIIGILASIAIPSYVKYIGKLQATEALNLSRGIGTKVFEIYTQKGTCPSNSDTSSGLDIPSNITGKYVANITIAGPAVATLTGDCTITARMAASNIAPGLENTTLKITMNLTKGIQSGAVNWICTSTAPPKYLPASCSIGS